MESPTAHSEDPNESHLIGVLFRTGIDHVEVEEFRDELEANPKLASTLFTKTELSESSTVQSQMERLAGRFAAKEAILKAFKTGWSDDVDLTEIEVSNDDSGAPFVVLTGRTGALACNLGIQKIEISISHTRHVAMAIAVLTLHQASRSNDPK